jgi:hypothetical protein
MWLRTDASVIREAALDAVSTAAGISNSVVTNTGRNFIRPWYAMRKRRRAGAPIKRADAYARAFNYHQLSAYHR